MFNNALYDGELSSLGSSRVVQAIASTLSLRTLPFHVDWIITSLVCFTGLYCLLAEPLTRLFIPKQWAAFTEKQKRDWKLRIVSLTQSVLLGPISLYIIWLQKTHWEHRSLIQRVYGYYEPETQVTNIALGYFIWHFAMMVLEYDKHGIQMVAHAVIGVGCLGGVYYPFTSNMTVWFLAYELTNIPHNIYKLSIPLGKSMSPLSVANALTWIASFLVVRIVWGTYATVAYMRDLYSLRDRPMTMESLGREEFAIVETLRERGMNPSAVGTAVLVWCTACATVLAGLNYFWFYLIVRTTVRKLSMKKTGHVRSKKVD